MDPFRQLIRGNKLWRHSFFSLAVLALLCLGMYLLQMAGFRFKNKMSAYTDCAFFLLCIYTGRWVAQRWYLRQKLALFGLYGVMAFMGLSVLKWLLVRYAFGHPYAGFLEVLRGEMPFFLVALVMGMLLKLIRASMQKELQDARLKTEQKTMEFNLLQSQLSPHFLFNVLNNLYGISIGEPKRIPPLLLKLSNLLRYSVYGAKKLVVPLKDELEYIRDYIEFEQIRMSDRLNLVMDIEAVSSPDIGIAPQVLIVFLENAFKHSKNTLSREINIDISLTINSNFICLEVSNSYQFDKSDQETLNESSGLGLPNTIKRLDLLYGDNYELVQKAENEIHHVRLRLKIK
jgi:hypothetical protein